jgi:type I restriction enzyme S subunit
MSLAAQSEPIATMTTLPSGWQWFKLGDVCDIIAGQSPPGDTYRTSPTGLPFFQGKADFGLRHPVARAWCASPIKVAEPGDILISVRAPVGPTNVAEVRCCIGRGLAAIRPRSTVDRDFILALGRAPMSGEIA